MKPITVIAVFTLVAVAGALGAEQHLIADDPLASLEIFVLDARTREPIPGATIQVSRRQRKADETWYLPVAPHNCGGPVLHIASAHLAANLTNLAILETVRRHYLDEYEGLLDFDLRPVDGELPLPPGPGLGVALRSEALERPGVVISRFSK